VKTAPEYFIANLLDLTWRWIIIFFALQLSCFFLIIKADEDLPGRMGYINEYGGLMSGSEQQEIEESLISIEEKWGMETVILVTLRDPYRNPQYMANKIMEEWQLNSKKSLLLLFVKEENSWFWERRFGADLASIVDLNYLDSQLEKIDVYVRRREITVAINKIVDILPQVMSVNPKIERADQKSFDKNALIYPLFGLLGVALLVILIRKLRNRLCFRCYRWLSIRESTPFGRGAPGGERHIIYYCPRCGYKKIKRVK
jgi:uncharacterized membrane protein YgcG